MFWLLFILGFGFLGVDCDRRRVEVMDGHGYSLAVKRIECFNSTVVSIHACKIKLLRGKTGAISVGMDFLQTYSNLLFRLYVERKTSANYYIPTVIDATFNLCDIAHNMVAMGVLKNMLTLFAPNGMELLEPFLHPCPYEGIHEALNVVVDKMTVPNVMSTGDAKIIGVVMDEKKKKLFELQAYVYIKSPSLMQIN